MFRLIVLMTGTVSTSEISVIFYKTSRYKSEVLRLRPQRCNTAKPTRCYNSFPQVQSNSYKTCNVVVAVPYTVHWPTKYEIKIYYLR
jgi:hypothetical protein